MGATPQPSGATTGTPTTFMRWLALCALLVGITWAGWSWSGGLHIAGQASDYLSPARQADVKTLLSTTKDFGFTRSIIVGIGPKRPNKEDIFSGRMLGLNRKLTNTLAAIDGVGSVLSIASSQAISKEKGALVVRAMFPAKTKKLTPAIQKGLRAQVMGDPLLRGSLVSPDAAYTLLIVQLKVQPAAKHKRAVTILRKKIELLAHHHRFAHISLTGQAIIGPSIASAAAKDGRAFGPVALVLFVLFLLVSLSWRQGLSALSLLVLTLLFGAMACFGLFGAVFAHKAWLFILAWWMAATWWFRPQSWGHTPLAPRGPKIAEPLSQHQRHLAALAITSLTALTMLVVPHTLLQRMGWAAWSAGLAAIALLALLFTPQYLAQSTTRLVPKPPLPAPLWWIVIILCSLGLFHLNTGGLLDAVYPKHSRLQLGEELQRKHFGGAAPLLIRFKGDLRDPTALKAVERLSRRLEAHPAIFGPQSIAGLIRQLNALLNKWPRVPDQEKQINALWMFLEGQPALQSLVRKQGKDGILQARVRMPRGWTAGRLQTTLRNMIADLPTRYRTVQLSSLKAKDHADALARRIPWIKEGIALWLQRHSQLPLPSAMGSQIEKIITTFTKGAHAPPAAKPVAPLRLQRKLYAYLTGKDCDLELTKTLQQRVLLKLLHQNQAGQLQQPGVLKKTLITALAGSAAAKDKDSIKYAMRTLRHILRQLHKQQHLERFQQALFRQFKRHPRFIQALSKSLRHADDTSPQRRMAELQAELMEMFSPTTSLPAATTTKAALNLHTTITGIPSLMLPLQLDAQKGLLAAICALSIAALLLLLLLLSKQLSAWRVVASMLLTWLLVLSFMGLFHVPLHLPTALLLGLLGMLSLLMTIPIALTTPSQRSYQHLIRLCLWLSLPCSPFLFASLPILQHAAFVLAIGPWLAATATAFTHTHD